MEQLNFRVGSTLGTAGRFYFGFDSSRVGGGESGGEGLSKNPHKSDFTGVCNSALAERSLGYARQIIGRELPAC